MIIQFTREERHVVTYQADVGEFLNLHDSEQVRMACNEVTRNENVVRRDFESNFLVAKSVKVVSPKPTH